MAKSNKTNRASISNSPKLHNTIDKCISKIFSRHPIGDPNNIRTLEVEPLTDEDYEKMIAEIRQRNKDRQNNSQ